MHARIRTSHSIWRSGMQGFGRNCGYAGSIVIRIASFVEDPHVFGLSHDVPLHGAIQAGAIGSRRQRELTVEGIQAEEVAMGLSSRRARSAVADLAIAVVALAGAVVQLLSPGFTFG